MRLLTVFNLVLVAAIFAAGPEVYAARSELRGGSSPARVSPSLGEKFTLDTPGPDELSSPIEGKGCTLSGRTFGCFSHPIDRAPKQHNGLDLKAPMGTNVVSPIEEGEIVEVKPDAGGHGKRVKIKITSGVNKGKFILMCHLSHFGNGKGGIVKVGDKVKRGDIVGQVGSTGKSTGPHLHMELEDENGKNYDPMEMIKRASGVDQKSSLLCKNVDPPKKEAGGCAASKVAELPPEWPDMEWLTRSAS